jgi:hypothetical protein
MNQAGAAGKPLALTAALTILPAGLRKDLLDSLNKISRAYREGRWEPAELNGGKLCEAAYSIIAGYDSRNFPSRAAKPRNLVDACKALEGLPKTVPRPVRIQIPRLLTALYEIRSNRGVGHAGGDVDPNHMDATAVLHMSKWVVAELVRLLHNLSTEDAAALVEQLVERELPIIWEVDGKRRVLNPGLPAIEKSLLILYSVRGKSAVEELRNSVGYGNPTRFRQGVLAPAHRKALLELNGEEDTVELSPLGGRWVEENVSLVV